MGQHKTGKAASAASPGADLHAPAQARRSPRWRQDSSERREDHQPSRGEGRSAGPQGRSTQIREGFVLRETQRPTIHHAPDGGLTLIFTSPDVFGALREAESWLRARGFSYGTWQDGSPAGVIFGAVSIAKWRGLDWRERQTLHGLMSGEGRQGPIEVRIYADAPPEARAAIVAKPAPKPDRVFPVAAAVVAIAILAPIVFVGWWPVFAPRYPRVGKIELRAMPIVYRATVEARR